MLIVSLVINADVSQRYDNQAENSVLWSAGSMRVDHNICSNYIIILCLRKICVSFLLLKKGWCIVSLTKNVTKHLTFFVVNCSQIEASNVVLAFTNNDLRSSAQSRIFTSPNTKLQLRSDVHLEILRVPLAERIAVGHQVAEAAADHTTVGHHFRQRQRSIWITTTFVVFRFQF